MKQTSIIEEISTDVYTVLPNVKKGVPDDRKAKSVGFLFFIVHNAPCMVSL